LLHGDQGKKTKKEEKEEKADHEQVGSKSVASASAEEYVRVQESPFPRVHGRPAWEDYLKLKKHAVGVSLGSDVG
jgi:hypothetical protein